MGFRDELNKIAQDIDGAQRTHEVEIRQGSQQLTTAARAIQSMIDEAVAFLKQRKAPTTAVIQYDQSQEGKMFGNAQLEIVGTGWLLTPVFALMDYGLFYNTRQLSVAKGSVAKRFVRYMRSQGYPEGYMANVVTPYQIPLAADPAQMAVMNSKFLFSLNPGASYTDGEFRVSSQYKGERRTTFGIYPDFTPALISYSSSTRDLDEDWRITPVEKWLSNLVQTFLLQVN